MRKKNIHWVGYAVVILSFDDPEHIWEAYASSLFNNQVNQVLSYCIW